MTLRAASLALAPELRAGVVAESEIAAAVAETAERLRQFTPHVEPAAEEPGVFWLDARGLERLFGSVEAWGAQVHADLVRARLVASLVFAAFVAGWGWTLCVLRDLPAEYRTGDGRSVPFVAFGVVASMFLLRSAELSSEALLFALMPFAVLALRAAHRGESPRIFRWACLRLALVLALLVLVADAALLLALMAGGGPAVGRSDRGGGRSGLLALLLAAPLGVSAPKWRSSAAPVRAITDHLGLELVDEQAARRQTGLEVEAIRDEAHAVLVSADPASAQKQVRSWQLRAYRVEPALAFWVDMLRQLGLLGTVLGLGLSLAVSGEDIAALLGPVALAVWATVAGLAYSIVLSTLFGARLNAWVDACDKNIEAWDARRRARGAA